MKPHLCPAWRPGASSLVRRGPARRSRARRVTPPALPFVLALVLLSLACREADVRGSDTPLGVASGAAPFREAAASLGLEFVHASGAPGQFDLPEITGSGVALFDYDGDKDLDAYFVNGQVGLSPDPARPRATNRLFRQEPDGRFTDVTAVSGLGDEDYGMGVAVGDADNDGDLDVYVSNYGADRFYRSRGDGTFEDATASAGIDVRGWSSSVTFLDYDRDGWLDLYVARYVQYDPAERCTDAAGRPDFCGPHVFPPQPDVLLHNDGDGTFSDVSAAAGIHAADGAGLGVSAEDFDGDGWPDVYVANDGWPNQLWLNRRDGTFFDAALVRGAAYNLHGKAEAGMGVVAEDLDGDGDLDLFLTHLAGETNTLYRNRGRGAFEDRTAASGMVEASLTLTGFGVVAFDLEHDGDLDLAIANGRVTRGPAGGDASPAAVLDSFAEPAQVFLNDGTGRFARPGELGTGPTIGRGLAGGDVDGDGDIDLLLGAVGASARLYLNEAPKLGSWLRVEAIDPRYRREAIGAAILVQAGGREQVRSVKRSQGYLSSSDPRAHFGLGRAVRVDRLEVRWPDGLREVFSVEGVDRDVTLVRGDGTAVP